MSDDISLIGIGVDSSGVRRGKNDLDDLAAAGGRAEVATDRLTAATSRMTNLIRSAAGIFATLGISKFIVETATLNQRYDELGIVLNTVARNAGLSAVEVNKTAEAIRASGISMIESRQVVARLVTANIDLAKATQLSRLAQDAAVVGQINSSEALDRMVHGITSSQVEVLRGIGINVNFEQSYARVAKQMGVTASALTENQKLQARLNVVLAESPKLLGIYEASMANAGKQLRSTERLVEDLKVKLGGLFSQTAIFAVTAYTNALKETDGALNRMTETDELKLWGDSVARTVAFVADSVRSVGIMFDITGKALGAMAAQAVAVSKFDFQTAFNIQGNFNKDLDSSIASMSKMRDLVESQIVQREMLEPAIKRSSAAMAQNREEADRLKQVMDQGAETAKRYADPIVALKKRQEELSEQLKAGAISQDVYNRALKAVNEEYNKPGIKSRKEETDRLNKAQEKAMAIEGEYIKLLEFERKAQTDLVAPYKQNVKSAEERLVAMQEEGKALELSRARQISLEKAIELTTIARLEEKLVMEKNAGVVRELEQEIAVRKKVVAEITNAEERTKRLGRTTSNVTDQITQFWIQANRNIQTSFANGIFDFFTDGLDGMVRSVKTAVLRIISEFAALKILEFFGGGTGTAGGTGGTVSTLATLASMFGGARTGGGGIATGGGVTTGAFSNAGGSGTAFIGGQGTALGGSGMGVTATRNSSMLSGGNLMALGAMAGPYGMAAAAAFMAMQALEKKVGDYKLSGGAKFALGAYEMFSPMAYTVKGLGLQTPEALIGKFLFGRGPYKFRQQSIQGDVSNEGLDGTITDVFKSKGGVFKKNKHKEFETPIPSEIIRDIDKTLANIYKSTNDFAKNLGFDASQIDKYTKEIQVKSEKGKTITTEAVTEMLTVVADEQARLVMPDVESFSLTGESASKTLERLNNELDALKTGAQNLGASAVYASDLVNRLSIDERMAGIDMVGGIERLNELTLGFFDSMLKPTEKLAVRTDQLNTELAKWGVSTDMSIEQYRELVQAESTANDFRLALLELVPAFLQVKNAAKQLKDTAYQNTLTLAQNFAPEEVPGLMKERANEALSQFGITADTSREKVTAMLRAFIKSGGMMTDIAGEVTNAAILYQEYQNSIVGGSQVAGDGLAKLQEAFQILTRSVETERSRITEQFNNKLGIVNARIQEITGSIGRLKAFSESLRSTANELAPMNREFAKRIAENAIKSGEFDSQQLQFAVGALKDQSTDGFKNSFEFEREQAKSVGLITRLGDAVDSKASEQGALLAKLELEKQTLENGFKAEMERLDSLLFQGQSQIDALNGINTSVMTLSKALEFFNLAKEQVSGGIPGVVEPVPAAPRTGNSEISDRQIREFASRPGVTDMEIYRAARDNGVSFEQYAAATGSNLQDLYKWADKNKVPKFESGGFHKGGLRVVGESGPEIEKTGQSHITSNKDLKKAMGIDELTKKVADLADAFEAVTQGNTYMNVKIMA